MAEHTISIPEGLEQAVQTTPEELEAEVKLMAALKMFELGKLSSGRAAELAGVSRAEFIDLCGRYGVSVADPGPGELESDLRAIHETVGHDRGQ